MRDAGIDMGAKTPQRLTKELARGAQVLVTMGQRQPAERVPAIRDDIRAHVARLIAARGWEK